MPISQIVPRLFFECVLLHYNIRYFSILENRSNYYFRKTQSKNDN